MKILHIILKVLTSLLIVTPIFGATGIFPPPTREMYQTNTAFTFIQALMNSYVMYGMSIVFFIALIALWTRRETLAALLMLPITVNIIGFHAFLDGGLLTAGAIMGNMLLIVNIYFLWKNRKQLTVLLG
jgi:hypothetical protein